MKNIPGTEYIKKLKNGKYIINKKIDGTTYCFGIYKKLDTAIYYRDYFQTKGWSNCIDERLNYSETYDDHDYNMRYIYLIKSTGNYQITKKIDGETVSFGNYDSLDEAMFWRDYFEENNWDIRYRLCYSKSSFINRLPSGRYQVIRQWNNTKTSFGTFDTIEEAEYQVLLCKRFNWDTRLKPFDCMKHIQKKVHPSGKTVYRIIKINSNGYATIYGTFNNLHDAQFERDLLVLCDWDYEVVDSIDESVDGVSWLSGKTAGTFFQKNIKGVNDYFWFMNSKKKELKRIIG